MALWRGAARAELASEPFAQAEAVRLDETGPRVLEDRISADLALGVTPSLEALRSYEAYRGLLSEQIGVSPSPELRRLKEALLLQSPTSTGRALLGSPRSPVRGLNLPPLRTQTVAHPRSRSSSPATWPSGPAPTAANW